MNLDRVLIVTKRSAYETYSVDQNDPHFKRFIAEGGPRVHDILASHREHHRTLEAVQKSLERLGAVVDRLDRGSAFDERFYNLVVIVGGDGTFVSAAHRILATPLLGVNSAPGDSVGFFCGATRASADRMLSRILRDDLQEMIFQRLRTEIDGEEVPEPSLNEVLYAHENPAAMARYSLRVGRRKEAQRSSGVWVGPPAGSRAAMGSAGGRKLPLEAKQFQFVVREPYLARGPVCRLRKGVLGVEGKLEIRNHFGHARIFIDGPHVSRPVPFGSTVRLRLGDHPLRVLGFIDRGAKSRVRGRRASR